MIIIERTITIKNDQATLDSPIYLYRGDGDIVCLFTIKEMKKATFGKIEANNPVSQASYGNVRIYKPDGSKCIFTEKAPVIEDKLQVIFSYENINDFTEVGVHKLQIHLYDDNDAHNESNDKNRFTLPPIDINVLLPVGDDNAQIDEAVVGYSLLNAADEEIPTFDENGNYNKTIWTNGDIITKDKLNKLEDALHQVTAADDNFVDEETFNTALNGKANVVHSHTEYATKKELNNKAPATHTHNNIYAPSNHTHNNYATREELSNKSDEGHGHSEYALKKDINIPTKVSQLTNDKEYITSKEIPEFYVTETELTSYGYMTKNYAEGRYATAAYVDAKILKAQIPEYNGSPNLDGFALKSDIRTDTAELTNGAGFITNEALRDYATKEYVGTTIAGELKNVKVDLSNYPTNEEMNNALFNKADRNHNHNEEYDNRYMLKGEIPEINIPTKLGDLENDLGYVTEETVNGAIENINNNLTNNYALKKDIPTVPTNVSAFTNDAGYAKETTVDEAISNINQNLTNNYVTKANMPTKVSQLENDKGYIICEGITKIKVVEELPYEEEPGVLYIVVTK